jgi:uncharacterized protein affecting Mg2+/Co2+ transport
VFVQYSELNQEYSSADDIIWTTIAKIYSQEAAEMMSDAQLRNNQAALSENSDNISSFAAIITMTEAIRLGAEYVNGSGEIITTPGGNFQFMYKTINEQGQTVIKIARFDVNPANNHVIRSGSHLNLQTFVNGMETENLHFNINPLTVQKGDIP